MDELKIDGTDKTPLVSFNTETNEFMIKGRSLPENALDFYQPVKDWATSYLNAPNDNTVLQVDLDYFNSISIKHITEVLMIFKELAEKDKNVTIQWFYDLDDDVVKSKGELLSGMMDINFELVANEE